MADRLNAYNVFRGDPALITTDIARFQDVNLFELGDVATRYLVEKPRVTLSVIGRSRSSHHRTTIDRAVPPASPDATPFRPPLPEIIPLDCGVPLWIISRRDLPTVAGTIIITAGASVQQPGEAGLAQLTANMLDEGTTTRSAEEIALAVESMGGSIDASSGWDGSYVSFRCLKMHLAPILDLAVDILLNPTFPDREWDRLRGQTLAALRAERDSAESRAYRALLSAVFPIDHPYRYPLVGSESCVARFGRTDLIRYHQQFLLPNVATIIAAGDVDPGELAGMLNDRLPSLRAAPRAADGALAPWARPGRRILLIDRPGASQAVVRAGHLGVARSVPAFESIMLLNQVLGGQFSSRLNTKLREERGFTYGVRSHFDPRRQPGPFSITTSVQADRLGDALSDLLDELAAIIDRRPPTRTELENARRALVEGHARHFETPSALVNRYANLLIHDLPLDHEAGYAERLAAVDLASLTEQAREHLHPDALQIIVVADAAEVVTDLERLGWGEIERLDIDAASA